ncbi:hypothetical protein ABPG75_001480 [Micractinium tetrahymenae]
MEPPNWHALAAGCSMLCLSCTCFANEHHASECFFPNVRADPLRTSARCAPTPCSEVFGLQRFRECELIHGRWAMLACLGALVQEAVTGDTWVAAQTLVYENPQYAGLNLPFSIYTLAVLNSLLMGGAELYRNTELDPERRCYPGGVFDPLNLASDDSERTSKLREAEIKHARLAMVSFLGYAVQAWYTGEGALGSLQKFANGF